LGAIGWEGKTKIYRMDAWKNPSPHPSKFNTLYTIYVYCCFLIFLFNSFFLDSFQLNSNCFIFVAWVDAGNVYWKIDVYIIEKIFLWYNNSYLFLFLSLSLCYVLRHFQRLFLFLNFHLEISCFSLQFKKRQFNWIPPKEKKKIPPVVHESLSRPHLINITIYILWHTWCNIWFAI
jgi:hypothetical protein